MRILTLALLAACDATGGVVVKDAGGVGDQDADTDADGDSDADGDGDSDGDSDSDSDADSDVDLPPDIVVDCNGDGDHVTIQEAINASVSGDRIGLKACEYHETIDFIGKSIEVYGIEGSAKTELDADYAGTAVDVETGEGGWTRLAGLTISDGYDPYGGAAIEVGYAVLELEDVVIRGNGAGDSMIYAYTAFLDATDVVIEGNETVSQAIYSKGGSFTGKGLTVDCDTGAQAIYSHNAFALSDSTLNCDNGYGLNNYHGELFLQRVRATGGVAGIYTYDVESTVEEPDSPTEVIEIHNSAIGGGTTGLDVRYQNLALINSVVWGDEHALYLLQNNSASYVKNSVFMGAACGVTGDAAIKHTFSAFYDNDADGCGVSISPTVSSDPEFVSFPDDLTLQSGSPLIDAGATDITDLDGSRSDIGMFGGPKAF